MEVMGQSITQFGDKAVAFAQLEKLRTECSEPGWDGDAAAAIDPGAVLRVKRLIRALPESFPIPEFAPEPDGSISVDWIRTRACLVSLSIGQSDRIAYAWLDGIDRGHAVAHFNDQNVPTLILETINAIMGQKHAGVRTA